MTRALLDGRPLRCRTGLVIRVRSDGECELDTPGGRVLLGPHTLAVLGAFMTPRSVQDAAALLEPQLAGRRGAIDLLTTIVQLVEAGALGAEGAEDHFASDSDDEGFGAVPLHVAMIGDAVRTEAWLAAVHASVRPSDVVVDVGTGTGILAIAAARAGARRVFAIEATACANVARAMVSDNGVADRVTVIRGWSTRIELPELASLLVTETLGDDPFREGILEATADAHRRLLASGARIIPGRVRLYAVPVEIGEHDRSRHVVTAELVQSWGERYGMQFERLLGEAGTGTIASVRPSHTVNWERLAEPVLLCDVELSAGAPEHLDLQMVITAARSGVCHGVVTFFEADLIEGIGVSTDPRNPNKAAAHWLNPTLLLSQPLPMQAGQSLRLRYRYPAGPALEVVA